MEEERRQIYQERAIDGERRRERERMIGRTREIKR